MKAESHKLIANTLFNTVKKETGITLNLELLEKGSYIPDYHYFWRLFSHRKQHLFEDVILQINYISRLIRSDLDKNIDKISYKLGIISHFICDFFTAPHNFFTKKELREHIKYESNLNQYVIKNIKPISYEGIEFKTNFQENQFDIKEYINKKHNHYLNEKYSFTNDLNNAVEVLATMFLFLLDTSIEIICPYKYELPLTKKRIPSLEEMNVAFTNGCNKFERNFMGRKVIRINKKSANKFSKKRKLGLLGKGTLSLLLVVGSR